MTNLLGTIWQLKESWIRTNCKKHSKYYKNILLLNEDSRRTDIPYRTAVTDGISKENVS